MTTDPAGAQRLSASQRSAPGTSRSVPRPLFCAQRLSASQRSARRGARPRVRQPPVLNAFRHHRGRHKPKRLARLSGRRCSTPFGITEVGTRASRPACERVPSAQRLSASQRSAQAAVCRAGRLAKCSTPFGITEVGTHKVAVVLITHCKCSTPFGITEVGTAPRGRVAARSRVLNAFRHHRGRHTE